MVLVHGPGDNHLKAKMVNLTQPGWILVQVVQVNPGLQAEGTTISSRIRSKSTKLGSFTN